MGIAIDFSWFTMEPRGFAMLYKLPAIRFFGREHCRPGVYDVFELWPHCAIPPNRLPEWVDDRCGVCRYVHECWSRKAGRAPGQTDPIKPGAVCVSRPRLCAHVRMYAAEHVWMYARVHARRREGAGLIGAIAGIARHEGCALRRAYIATHRRGRHPRRSQWARTGFLQAVKNHQRTTAR